jgi:hypothetical protein
MLDFLAPESSILQLLPNLQTLSLGHHFNHAEKKREVIPSANSFALGDTRISRSTPNNGYPTTQPPFQPYKEKAQGVAKNAAAVLGCRRLGMFQLR